MAFQTIDISIPSRNTPVPPDQFGAAPRSSYSFMQASHICTLCKPGNVRRGVGSHRKGHIARITGAILMKHHVQRHRKPTVMVVDDNRSNQVALEAVLGEEYDVVLASSGY